MSGGGKINRKHVQEFFTWQDRKICVVGCSFATFCVAALSIWLGQVMLAAIVAAIGGVLVFCAIVIGNKFGTYYEAVQKAKRNDFSMVLLRSFRKTETDLRALLDFDAQDLINVDLQNVPTQNRNALEALFRKSVFLFGKRAEDGPLVRFVRVNGKLSIEYSPIFVSVLYLTKDELIVYLADVDIAYGDLKTEEVNRVFLKNIVEVTSASATERITREKHEHLFKEYEKVAGRKMPDELVYRNHLIRVTKTDGRNLTLPVGAPQYSASAIGVLDGDASDDDDRFARVSREIIKRINDAQARI